MAVVGIMLVNCIGADHIGGLDAVNECVKGAACGGLTGYTVKGLKSQMVADAACGALMDAAGVDFAQSFRSPEDKKEFQRGMDAGSSQTQMALYKPYMPCVTQKIQEKSEAGEDISALGTAEFQEMLISCGYKPKEEPKGGWNFFGMDAASFEGGGINALCGGGVGLLTSTIAKRQEAELVKRMEQLVKEAGKATERRAVKAAEKAAEKKAARVAEKRAANILKAAQRRAAKVAEKRAAQVAEKTAARLAEKAAAKATAKAAERAAEKSALKLGLNIFLAELPPHNNATNAAESLDNPADVAMRLARETAAQNTAEQVASKVAAADALTANAPHNQKTNAAEVAMQLARETAAPSRAQHASISKAVGFGAVVALMALVGAVYKMWNSGKQQYATVDVEGQWPIDGVDMQRPLPLHGKGHQPGAGFSLPPQV